MPKISILMAVFNEHPTHLKKAMHSILHQTYNDFEFIIINDCSNNSTTKILQFYKKHDHRIKLLTNPKNIGLTKSLNIAIKSSKGEFIARMDGDDISLPHRLSFQLNFILQNNLDLIGSNCNIIDEQGNTIKNRITPVPKNYKKEMFKHPLFAHSTFFGKRKVFIELYNETFETAQDYEFLLRLIGKNYKIGHTQESLLLYRLNSQGISIKKIKKQDLSALRIRLLAITKYNYPVYYIIYMLKSVILFLIPLSIQHFILYTKSKT